MKRAISFIASLSLGAAGYLHFRLWAAGYRYAPIREMFVVTFVLAAVIGVALLASKWFPAAAGAALSAGSLTALALSRTVGLPTPHGRWTEVGLAPGQTLLGVNETLLIIIAELVAVVACAAVLMLALRSRRVPVTDSSLSMATRPDVHIPTVSGVGHRHRLARAGRS